MTDFDRSENARTLHENRKAANDRKANAAIDELLAAGRKVTFAAVAERAGLSAATLYGHEVVRGRIEALRETGPVRRRQCGRPGASDAALVESLKRKVERLRRENASLREENERLRSAANRTYSDYLDAV